MELQGRHFASHMAALFLHAACGALVTLHHVGTVNVEVIENVIKISTNLYTDFISYYTWFAMEC